MISLPANYVLLQRIELNASASSISFTNIPQSGYTDLKFVMSARQSTAAVAADVLVTFNGSTSSNSNRYLLGDSASASSGFDGYTPSSNYISIGVGNNATANTFSSVEMYIPNYLSSNNKSFSVDSVSESNGTTSVFQFMLAGLWSSSSAINQITVTPASSQSFLQYSTFSLYGLAAVGTEPVIAPKATGGNITSDGTYWIHTFNSTGTFTPLQGLSCDYLVVAGGAGGGTGQGGGGGGGAGGLRSTVTATGGGGSLESVISVASGTAYTIQVGAGGAGGVGSAIKGTNGVNSIFSTITSTGGGGGSGGSTGNGAQTGGSGGGGNFFVSSGAGASGTTNQGYAGGTGADANAYGGGGGGGAGAVGSNGTTTIGGNGGNGVATSITGSSVTYAGGGGGGRNDAGTLSSGGTGGGGSGGGNNVNNAVAGTINLGGGGGAGGGGNQPGKAGGSGIVIIRYPIA